MVTTVNMLSKYRTKIPMFANLLDVMETSMVVKRFCMAIIGMICLTTDYIGYMMLIVMTMIPFNLELKPQYLETG